MLKVWGKFKMYGKALEAMFLWHIFTICCQNKKVVGGLATEAGGRLLWFVQNCFLEKGLKLLYFEEIKVKFVIVRP